MATVTVDPPVRVRRRSRYPGWKVYSPSGTYVGATYLAEDAGALVAAYGEGATIRWGHSKARLVWTDGVDGYAGDSYDVVGVLCNARLDVLMGVGNNG